MRRPVTDWSGESKDQRSSSSSRNESNGHQARKKRRFENDLNEDQPEDAAYWDRLAAGPTDVAKSRYVEVDSSR